MQGLEPDRARATGYSRAQRHDVRLIALLRGASLLGDAVALVALYLRVAPLGHSWAIAALAIASSAPLVAFAPLAGYVIDRLPAQAPSVREGSSGRRSGPLRPTRLAIGGFLGSPDSHVGHFATEFASRS